MNYDKWLQYVGAATIILMVCFLLYFVAALIVTSDFWYRHVAITRHLKGQYYNTVFKYIKHRDGGDQTLVREFLFSLPRTSKGIAILFFWNKRR